MCPSCWMLRSWWCSSMAPGRMEGSCFKRHGDLISSCERSFRGHPSTPLWGTTGTACEIPRREGGSIRDVQNAGFFWSKCYVSIVFTKRKSKCCSTTIPLEKGLVTNKSWKFNAHQKWLRKRSLPSEKKRDGQFLPNNNNSNR